MGPATPGRHVQHAKHGAGIRSGRRTRIEASCRCPCSNIEISAKITSGWITLGYSRCSHWHTRARQGADGQSGTPISWPVVGVPLAHLSTLRFVEQCQDTGSRFIDAVPRYRLD
jgi:hypothetical protein